MFKPHPTQSPPPITTTTFTITTTTTTTMTNLASSAREIHLSCSVSTTQKTGLRRHRLKKRLIQDMASISGLYRLGQTHFTTECGGGEEDLFMGT
ncbi:hypothetical protein QJS04_geneDACA007959 [Acorus gramineus]|uniref:Uncharacterized protein n=1 Tax=Acorus gramineus TaxID=55184 RepID=A0AAV9B714_ACOGR|nr:hypothetical protein QJS04_geneDACA007959 [Acorus gramineus]